MVLSAVQLVELNIDWVTGLFRQSVDSDPCLKR